MKKNTAVTVTILAWDTILNAGKTGDQANITVRGVGDGAEFVPSAPNVTQVDAVNLPGAYNVSLAMGENNYNSMFVGGKSATANIVIFGLSWINEAEDFTATEKASITAAVPGVAAIQSGLALAATALSSATWTNARAAFLDVAVSSLGTGITSFPAQTYTITSGGAPCADCLVVMTTDISGLTPIHSGSTNALGQVTFYPNLPAGTTVYLWRFKTGVNFVNPDTETIS